MIQKKICMVGVYGTGKTCLVQQFVHSIFSVKYLSTVGVKIDKKELKVGDEDVTLVLWDLEGRDGNRDINASYLRGAHGVIYVADGTRRDTADQLTELRGIVEGALGKVPSVVALNKIDLKNEWKLSPADEAAAGGKELHRVRTSAKTGEGVEATFQWLAEAALATDGAAK
jgi:small GTP-binding protein